MKAAVSDLSRMMTDCSCGVTHPLQDTPFNARVNLAVDRRILCSEAHGKLQFGKI
jgi:hypothetical protein